MYVQNHSIDLLRLAIADVCYETARAPLSSEPSIRSSMGSALLTRHRNAQNWANWKGTFARALSTAQILRFAMSR